MVAIATDENQHKSYNKMDEETRYNDLFMAFSGNGSTFDSTPTNIFQRRKKEKILLLPRGWGN